MTQQRRKEGTSEARTHLPEKHESEGVSIERVRSAPNDVPGAIVVKHRSQNQSKQKESGRE